MIPSATTNDAARNRGAHPHPSDSTTLCTLDHKNTLGGESERPLKGRCVVTETLYISVVGITDH